MEGGSTLHQHCSFCIKVSKCSEKPQKGDSCEIIYCNLNCGSRFHSCKLDEHKLLCSHEKIPCINSINGCPIFMERRLIGRHLEKCPASVVHCTMEWNRWPVNLVSHHQGLQQQMPLHPMQLDVALALRDQRMLSQWWKAPCRTKKVLRNELTKKYPAVPLHPYCGLREEELSNGKATHSCSDNDTEDIDESEDDISELQENISDLYKASRQATESLSAALNAITSSQNERSDLSPQSKFELELLNLENLMIEQLKEENPENEINGDFHENGTILYSPLIPSCQEDAHSNIFEDDYLSNSSAEENDCDVLFVSDSVVSDISAASMIDHARKYVNPPFPIALMSSPQSSNESLSLGLDLNMESFTRYQSKPTSMYTFLCSQEFRRDEYAWHYKNVHGDIQSGLNGWLEQRCPLAQYGCMFSRRRFYPMPYGSFIVHSDISESFGLQHSFPILRDRIQEKSAEVDYSQKLELQLLPYEVLQHIARFLDSFSLCNLALTSSQMREVCGSLLKERGIVVFKWERRKDLATGKFTWQVAKKHWCFSSAFSPVEKWCFEENNNMSNHLKTCEYFHRNEVNKAYRYYKDIAR